MNDDGQHPSPDALEAVAFGWLADADEAAAIRAHAAGCPRCGARLAADEEVRRHLLALRADEPDIDVLDEVLRHIAALPDDQTAGGDLAWRPRRRPAREWRRVAVAAVLALALVLGGLLALAPGALRAATGWLRTTVIREVPPPGQPGALPTRIGVPGATSPLRRVTLAEARRLVTFPVALPRALPPGFALAEVTIFQSEPDTPPSQVFVSYRRPGAAQPLVLTYQTPDAPHVVTAPPGATQDLTVGGHRAVYVDLAAEGARPASGSPTPLQLGRLIVERPDILLTVTGDRRDGLDLPALRAVAASVP